MRLDTTIESARPQASVRFSKFDVALGFRNMVQVGAISWILKQNRCRDNHFETVRLLGDSAPAAVPSMTKPHSRKDRHDSKFL